MTLSHELRTPLNAILGWVQILRSGWSGDATEALNTIDRNARAQVQLVKDLLDVSRIVSGKLRLDSRPVDIQRVAMQAIDVVRAAAAAKQVELLQVFDGSRPLASHSTTWRRKLCSPRTCRARACWSSTIAATSGICSSSFSIMPAPKSGLQRVRRRRCSLSTVGTPTSS